MLRNTYCLFVGLLGLALLLNSCRRYEEGPFISLRTVENRVQNTWKWSLALENSINRTGELADSTITFFEDNTVRVCADNEGCREGAWNLITKKSRLQLIFGTQATAYDFRFLSAKEMWLRLEDSSNFIEWELIVEE